MVVSCPPTAPPDDEARLMTAQAAEHMKVHPDTLRSWADDEIIPSTRSTAGYRLFRQSDLVIPTYAEIRRRRMAKRRRDAEGGEANHREAS